MQQPAQATWCALGAIALWATLASFSVKLAHVPPFLLTGLGLTVGGLLAIPLSGFNLRKWRVPPSTLALGVYGLFGYHFSLFIALRNAPPVEANLINYLWPLLIVLLAPTLLPGLRTSMAHIAAALVGFTGAVLAIAGGQELGGLSWGYLPALGAALIWATYSLLTRRVAPFSTAAIGGFCAAAAALSLLCSALLESRTSIPRGDWTLIILMGLGPLGAAFFLWDRALKLGDPRRIGVLSFLTPLASTLLLLIVRGQEPTLWIATAAVLIVGSAAAAFRLS